MTNINEKNNYKKMINNFYENEKNNIYNKIIIFDYGFDNSYIYKKFENITMSFSKIEYYKNIQQGFINNELKDEIALKKKYLFKRIKKYKSNKKIFMIINNFIQKGNIVGYSSNMNIYEDLLKEYKKERLKYKSQNVGKRIYQMTEIAKLGGSINDNDNSCIIF